MILGNLHQIMNDPDAFPDPTVFKPERFLNEDGAFAPDERVVPFGVGKHVCLGKELADAQCYLFPAVLLQRFTFHFAADKAVTTSTAGRASPSRCGPQ